MWNSVAFSRFTVLYNHHHYHFPELCYLKQKLGSHTLTSDSSAAPLPALVPCCTCLREFDYGLHVRAVVRRLSFWAWLLSAQWLEGSLMLEHVAGLQPFLWLSDTPLYPYHLLLLHYQLVDTWVAPTCWLSGVTLQ